MGVANTYSADQNNNNYINDVLFPGGKPNTGIVQLPKNPGYLSLVSPDGKLLPQYQLQAQGALTPELQQMLDAAKLDPTALDALTGKATATGPSLWAQLSQLLNKTNTATQAGNAGASANAAKAGIMSTLASHGGLRQGAMQNLARSSAKDLMNSKQDIFKQGYLNDLDIQKTDETNKNSLLGQAVTGAQGAATLGQNAASLWGQMAGSDRNYATSVNQSNIASLLANNQGQNSYNQNMYNTNMTAWSAKQQADATAAAAQKQGGLFGGGGFLGLGI